MPSASPASRDLAALLPFALPPEVKELLVACPELVVARNAADLAALSVRDAGTGWHEVAYDVPGRGPVKEARVCRVRNGVAAHYFEPYLRQADPDCLVIGDQRPTDKPTYRDRFGADFGGVRTETLAWLRTQSLVVFPFTAGLPGHGMPALVVAPSNAGFFAFGLALMQGILSPDELPAGFAPRAVIYVAPPFRHTHFSGRQVVVHNRCDPLHELFSYSLYLGSTARKGIYGLLLNLGEEENWTTLHCSTVEVTTPYHNKIVVAHEGADGAGKSEMLEPIRRQPDGTIRLGRNVITGEERQLTLTRACELRPVTDDMALCHPALEKGRGKLTVLDAESGWFVRVNEVNRYGVDPRLEALTVSPGAPLLFLNLDAQPGATALIWEHVEDAPGRSCPNPRVVIPRRLVPGVVSGPVDIDIRSFGVRTPPCTRDQPTFGIIGFFHLLPPALAWLWRLVTPSGYADPVVGGMTSEGVGSYWPYATGRRVDQANILLNQILERPEVRYILVPNQHVGAWQVGFMPQWIAREYLASRGGARFRREEVRASRCPLLGYTPHTVTVEGRPVGAGFFEVDRQPEVGAATYDRGAMILAAFFRRELPAFLTPDLLPLGRRIIELCLAGGSLERYEALIDHETILPEG